MKGKIERKKRIGKIGTLVIMGLFAVIMLSPSVIAPQIIGDHILMGDTEWIGLGAAKGRIVFDDEATDEIEILDANVGIGDTSPDFKLEVTGSSGDGYFGISSTDDEGDNGDIFIIDSSGNVGIGTPIPIHKLEISDSDITANRAGLYVAQTGAPSLSGDTLYGLKVIKTGSGSGTNVAGYFSATQGTLNYGLIVENGDVGIGIATPVSKLTVAGGVTIGTSSWASSWPAPSNGLIVEGNVGIGSTVPGAKLDVHVDSGPAATIGHSSNDAVGDYAIAMGYSTWAFGHHSTAMGYDTSATGLYSTAMGSLTTASGSESTAMGFATTASASDSTAMGTVTEASAKASTAMGWGSEASGVASTAMGFGTTARGDWSTATGRWTTASGLASTAMGDQTTASGWASTTMGSETLASGDYSIAMGRLVTAGSGSDAIVIGSGADFYNRLVNDVSNSLMVGFNSDEPTLFVGSSNGAGTTGKVGIGTANPGARLDVSPTVTSTADYTGIKSGIIYNGASAMAKWYGAYIATPTGTGSITNKYALATEENAGNVGIGTVNPGTRLEVNGVITAFDGTSTDWNTAFDWGDHALAGYLTSENDPQVGANSNNYVPRWDGTAGELVTGAIYDNGDVGIGSLPTTSYKLTVDADTGDDYNAIYGHSSDQNSEAVTGWSEGSAGTGVYGIGHYGVYGSGSTTASGVGVYGEGYYGIYGVGERDGTYGYVNPSAGDQYRGVIGWVEGSQSGTQGTNIGVMGEAENGATNIGVYGTASGGGTKDWAGYFDDGDVYIENKLGIGADPGTDANDKLVLYWASGVDAKIARGTNNPAIVYIRLRNADGEMCYLYPNATRDDIIVQSTVP